MRPEERGGEELLDALLDAVIVVGEAAREERPRALRRLRLADTNVRDAAEQLADDGFDPYAA